MNSTLFMSQWGRRLAKKLMKPIQKFKPNDQGKDRTRWNIVRGDLVEVIQGPQVGQRGKVAAVIREKNRLIVEGVNMRRRIIKPQADGSPGRIITRYGIGSLECIDYFASSRPPLSPFLHPL